LTLQDALPTASTRLEPHRNRVADSPTDETGGGRPVGGGDHVNEPSQMRMAAENE